ncbi:MAG: twin-arginine translocase subunit TatC [Deltaproteobacteria bacterium]|nr:twin-arginine translocase subunit TatC [Deltaproteobacteria bacterium]
MRPLVEYFENPERIIAFLEVFRKGLIQVLAVVFIFAVIGYGFAKTILDFLQKHTGVTLAYYGLSETFFTLLNIALFSSLFVTVPFLLFKVLSALRAVFPTLSRKTMIGFWIGAVFLFYLGAGFCLFVTLPYGTKFLLSYQSSHIEAIISVKKFVSFCLLFIFAFGIIFELPLTMILLGRIGLVKVSFLTRYRSYAILVITVLSAVLTPTPDAFNMMLMAVPLYLLFEIGIIGMRLWGKKEP